MQTRAVLAVEQVPGVRIAVEDAVHEHLLERGVHDLVHDGLRLRALRRELADRPAREELHRQHGARRQLRVGTGHRDLARRVEVALELEQVREFLVEVEFLEQSLLEFLDHRHDAEDLHLVDAGLQDLRGQVEQVEVRAHRRLDAGPLDLHDHLVAVAGARTVRLRNGGRRERHLVERRVQILQRAAEAGLDLLADRRERQGRRVVLQRLERRDPVRRKEVLAHREDLPELDVRGPERREQLGEAHRRREFAQRAVALGRPLEQPPGERNAHQQGSEAVLRDDHRHGAQAVEVAQRDPDHGGRVPGRARDRGRRHGTSARASSARMPRLP